MEIFSKGIRFVQLDVELFSGINIVTPKNKNVRSWQSVCTNPFVHSPSARAPRVCWWQRYSCMEYNEGGFSEVVLMEDARISDERSQAHILGL